MLRAPQSWSPTLAAAVAMLLLAGLDLAGAFVAKEAVVRRSWQLGIVGVLIFAALFWVYCSGLQYADLAVVTLGWVVLLQVGVVLLDRWRYGVQVTPPRLIAVLVLLAVQAFLLVSPAPAVEASTGRGSADVDAAIAHRTAAEQVDSASVHSDLTPDVADPLPGHSIRAGEPRRGE